MIDFNLHPLIPAIVQDAATRRVLMVAYMNQQSFEKTRETGQAWFWSRSRQELWHKGATSGNFMNIQAITADCDGDTLLIEVNPVGHACHTGALSCFFDVIVPGTPAPGDTQDGPPGRHPMDELFATVDDRRSKQPEGSYVAKLLSQGVNRVAKKVTEEAGETVIAAVGESDQRVIEEVADLWFHSLILLAARNLTPADIYKELAARRR
ncbi:MAG: bifunctional phosphoribosyl-AMP cyclohydrolase/phosphoribosyl-ATP diphosphatase HisIE [Dehalococcoidia bacterium]|nr:bifunctional phosphoribosyl-AMP cyclohydrolase/phosphoribosyl-ATP diphosphatase HisIE [Dehalococcoidia bacterium]